MTLPLVSCICPTYNRPPFKMALLEETIESFLRQTYPNRELVILSDAPGQTLTLSQEAYKHPEAWKVRIVCINERIKSLGMKYNELVQLARGDLLMPWEDDDISLTNRIKQAVEAVGEDGYWKPPQVWYLQKGQPPVWKHNVGVRHHASVFTRAAWMAVGGYPRISGAQDAAMDSMLLGLPNKIVDFPDGIGPEEWQYVYRWGVSDCHVSGSGKPDEFYEEWGKRPVSQGVFKIVPRWLEDYSAMCRSSLPTSS